MDLLQTDSVGEIVLMLLASAHSASSPSYVRTPCTASNTQQILSPSPPVKSLAAYHGSFS